MFCYFLLFGIGPEPRLLQLGQPLIIGGQAALFGGPVELFPLGIVPHLIGVSEVFDVDGSSEQSILSVPHDHIMEGAAKRVHGLDCRRGSFWSGF